MWYRMVQYTADHNSATHHRTLLQKYIGLHHIVFYHIKSSNIKSQFIKYIIYVIWPSTRPFKMILKNLWTVAPAHLLRLLHKDLAHVPYLEQSSNAMPNRQMSAAQLLILIAHLSKLRPVLILNKNCIDLYSET